MNQIKFRGKDSKGDWHFGGITKDKKFIVSHFTFQNVRADSVGQFTGLYDFKGKAIYEGDVVEINQAPYIVKWLDNKGRFIYANESVQVSLLNINVCTVVGNIHDSPKLFHTLQKEFLRQREKENRELETL